MNDTFLALTQPYEDTYGFIQTHLSFTDPAFDPKHRFFCLRSQNYLWNSSSDARNSNLELLTINKQRTKMSSPSLTCLPPITTTWWIVVLINNVYLLLLETVLTLLMHLLKCLFHAASHCAPGCLISISDTVVYSVVVVVDIRTVEWGLLCVKVCFGPT